MCGYNRGGESCPPTQTIHRPCSFPKLCLLPCPCSKAPSSSATKALIPHLDLQESAGTGRCHRGFHSPLAMVGGSAWHRGRCPLMNRPPPCPCAGSRFVSPKGDTEAGHHLVVPGHSTRRPTRVLPTHTRSHALCTHVCAPQCPELACECAHTCPEHTHVHTSPRVNAHLRVCRLQTLTGGCPAEPTGAPTATQLSAGFPAPPG